MMICPNCHKEMEPGYLQGHDMLWAKRVHKGLLVPGNGEFLVSRRNFIPQCFNAYICRNCHKIIFNFANTVHKT